MRRRLRIDRLDVDLRGVDPATAGTVGRALGPALGAALGRPPAADWAPSGNIDAGHVTTAQAPGAREIAGAVARQIARALTGGRR